jgi:pilus assembly protein CpaC
MHFLPSKAYALMLAALACSFAEAAKQPPAKALTARTASSVAATAPSSPCSKVEMGPMVKLTVGKSAVLKPQAPLTRVMLGNPDHAEVARPSEGRQRAADGQESGSPQQAARRPGVADIDVLLLSPSEIYLLGKTVGSTNIVLLDRTGRCTALDVSVDMDTAALTASLKELLPGEGRIKVSAAADSLVLSGTVADAVSADRALDIAGAYVRRASGSTQGGRAGTHDRVINMLSVSAPQQVMLEVKVAEVSKALLDQFGINFTRAYSPADGSMVRFLAGLLGGKSLVLNQVAGTIGGSVGSGAAAVVAGGTAASGISAPAGSVTATNGTVTQWPAIAGRNATGLGIDAQKQDGLVKLLAEPTVMAISGQEGSFLAGGKIFIPVATNNSGGGTTITLEEKEFGVSLKFTPTVLADGRINLKVSPEVSELNAQGVAITATNVAGTAILPSFTTRRAATTVQLMDGQSFAIGGLIKNNVTANLTAFPFLGEIPVLGALFRSTSFQNDRSELVFVITPRLVKPLPANYSLPTDGFVEPSRSDLILNGKLEGVRGNTPAERVPREYEPTPLLGGGFELK